MSSNCTINFRLFVQKRNIEFQIDQSHSAKLSGLPNAIGQFTFQYCVFVDNQLALTISRNGTERTGTLHYFTERNGRYCQFHFLLISLRFERAWSVSVCVIKLLPQDSEHASRLRTRFTLTHVRSEVKSTVADYVRPGAIRCLQPP